MNVITIGSYPDLSLLSGPYPARFKMNSHGMPGNPMRDVIDHIERVLKLKNAILIQLPDYWILDEVVRGHWASAIPVDDPDQIPKGLVWWTNSKEVFVNALVNVR